MDLKSNHTPVLTDPVPITKSRLGMTSNLLTYPSSGALFTPALLYIPRKKPGLFDDIRNNNWLNAMISSSPPARRIDKDFRDFLYSDDDVFYCKWMVKYPSALSSFEQISAHAKGKRIALFLDYDGTLSPIVDDPDSAFMSDAMRTTVKMVAQYFPTAIISGRSRDKVYEFVGLEELCYAGSHGMDIMGPLGQCSSMNKEVNLFQPAAEFLPVINRVYDLLVQSIEEISGAMVENNKFCVSVHYRNVEEKNWKTVAKRVYDIINKYPQLRVTHGRKVLEVRPMISWDKGKAVTFLLESLGLSNWDEVLPIYIGDDRTDEDAFNILRDENRGYGILVSSVPKESSAFYSLRDTSEVMEFLKLLVKGRLSGAI